MKKILLGLATLLCPALFMSGCASIGEKTAGLSVVYGATALIAVAIWVGYLCLARKKSRWLIALLSSVLLVNVGYFMLGVSSTLGQALTANRIAYFGSVFLPVIMLVIIMQATKIHCPKWLIGVLLGVSLLVFLVAASPGILTIYYKQVSLSQVNGVTVLNKVYGPWHALYLYYLLGYFVATVAVLVRGYIKKTTGSFAHSMVMSAAFFVNLGVWLMEQLVHIDFELLAVSYIISELFLLGLQDTLLEQERLKALVEQQAKSVVAPLDYGNDLPAVDENRLQTYQNGLDSLTPTETAVYQAYLARMTTKEILANLNIKENTLKFHNRNIYSKLGVSSRRELMELHAVLQRESE